MRICTLFAIILMLEAAAPTPAPPNPMPHTPAPPRPVKPAKPLCKFDGTIFHDEESYLAWNLTSRPTNNGEDLGIIHAENKNNSDSSFDINVVRWDGFDGWYLQALVPPGLMKWYECLMMNARSALY